MSEIAPGARPSSRRFKAVLAALAVTVLAGSVSTQSYAADRNRHARGAVRHVYHRPPPRPVYGYDAPTYVQSPPPLVYVPPAYASPFTLGLSFNIH